jgi:hypothetical protein
MCEYLWHENVDGCMNVETIESVIEFAMIKALRIR